MTEKDKQSHYGEIKEKLSDWKLKEEDKPDVTATLVPLDEIERNRTIFSKRKN